MDLKDFQLFPYPNALLNIITLIGLLGVLKFFTATTWNLAVGMRAHVWSKLRNKNFVETYGKWAVVTGSSDGIGKGYAYELAKKGMNLLLISRTMEKLQKIKEEIDKEFGVEVEIMQVDFSHGKQVYDEIEERVKGKEIGLLGMYKSYDILLLIFSQSDNASFFKGNPHVTNIVKRKYYHEIFITDKNIVIKEREREFLHGWDYDKAFVDFFSDALGAEYENSGVTFQTVTPAYVSTNMTSYSEKIHKPRFFVPTASNYAAHAVDTLGYTSYTTGYWTHGIQHIHFLQAFVDFFSEALGAEYENSGVTFQTVTPAYVSTNMTSYSEKIHKPRFFVPTASNYAAHAVDTLGYTSYTTGYWTHGIQAWIMDNFFSRWIWIKILKKNCESLLKDSKKTKNE
ncbi:inactive hydroxysteroid dehydrogenase-like protein 1 [Penaeus monodon]|uniref:inactive hydroxysteroid dehydrogenase-like protein 1 n=1 Tax=Penaeus monodon TaxID=6687 RepID=UPI0018A7A834|nr:inactive hydroxysteroid dehydrogenase-like protein 1 [Penaeus monodon]